MRGDALYRVVVIYPNGARMYAYVPALAPIGLTIDARRAASLPIDQAMQVLRQVRRRMASDAAIEAAP
jgi:hypothetical protein